MLLANDIPHSVTGGSARTVSGIVSPHYWILCDGWTVDYRLRMWAGETMPHGVFVPPEDVKYFGRITAMPCNRIVFEILTGEKL